MIVTSNILVIYNIILQASYKNYVNQDVQPTIVVSGSNMQSSLDTC